MKMREKFSKEIFNLMKNWLLALVIILVFQGAGIFDLDARVVKTLLISTKVGVIGLIAGVVAFLFYRA